MKILAIVAWTSWGVLLAALLFAIIKGAAHPAHSPEASAGLGASVVGFVLIVLLGAGGLLYWLAQIESRVGVAIMAVLLTYPAVLMAARPIVLGYQAWRAQSDDNDASGFALGDDAESDASDKTAPQ